MHDAMQRSYVWTRLSIFKMLAIGIPYPVHERYLTYLFLLESLCSFGSICSMQYHVKVDLVITGTYGICYATCQLKRYNWSCRLLRLYNVSSYVNSVWPRGEFLLTVLRSFSETRDAQDALYCLLEWRLNPMPRGTSHDTDRRVRKNI